MSDKDEQRPRVTGWLEEPGAVAARLLPAVGHVVIAVASLEKAPTARSQPTAYGARGDRRGPLRDIVGQ